MASCPFSENHLTGKDERPSFAINIEKGVYNCFSCGARGTIEDLVAKIKDCSVASALSMLTDWGFDRLAVELERKEVNEPPEFLPEGILYYYEQIPDDFAEVYRGEVDGKDCLIYPVRNRDGKLVGALARSQTDKWHKVMWNMNKKRYLYGEDKIEPEKPVIIVEGPGDLIALRKSGLPNAVALMGISCSDEQVEKLLSLSSTFVVWLDKDRSGAKGMNNLLRKLEKRATMLYVDPWKQAKIKDRGDAKQVLEDFGPESVREIVSNAKTLLEHVMEDS